MTKNYPLITLLLSNLLLASYCKADIDNTLDWSARARYAEFDGDESARAASLLLRATLDTHWNDTFSTDVQLDNVSRAFKNEHSDGVHLNGKPVIPDPGGFDLNQIYVKANLDSVTFKLGRQRINLDDQRFVGGNGFWQNEQTFDAALANVKLFSNSQLTYAYIDNANRIYGEDADKYLQPGDQNYAGPESERPAASLGDHRHHTHLVELDLNEWDYSQVKTYAFHIDNVTMPSVSNNTVGGNYTFTYKLDAVRYHVKLETAAQKQTEINDSPVLPYYLANIGVGISHIEFDGRYEVLGNKEGTSFVTPLASGHDFQGLANQISNYAAGGLKDASIGISWRSSPFKIESRYHQFNAYTNNDYLAQELDLIFGYKPNRKHAVTLLLTSFKPEVGYSTASTQKIYLDYAYNF